MVAFEDVIFRQFVDDGLGCASYLVGDEEAGTAAVVDPAYAVEQYLEEAERRHVRLTRVLETHTHADHLSGHGRLALDHGCIVSIHEAAEAVYPHEALDDGATVEVGARTRKKHPPKNPQEGQRYALQAASVTSAPVAKDCGTICQ